MSLRWHCCRSCGGERKIGHLICGGCFARLPQAVRLAVSSSAWDVDKGAWLKAAAKVKLQLRVGKKPEEIWL